ncbi:MAG: 2-phospho-L-lactate guanylyltransferase [Myxococcales bacterium]
MSAIWAVLPAKGFQRAKSRLGEVLSDPVRAAFARGLFEHVVSTLQQVPTLANVLVLTDDPEVEALALARGAQVLRDAPGFTLAQIIDAGLARAAALGAEAALVCMADLPHLAADEIRTVVEALKSAPVAVSPDGGEAGTNVLALKPPTLFASCFGRGDSFQQHLARAEAHGCEVRVLRAPGLCFDVDGPQDLEGL